ncbi:rhodanese-related sulfurtransferase [Melghiribacillus thermohalophilus]|uniref:Rhodanese-related sulfurtransferase n=1 Tax=Melghiribacillus thermohalophilus TaxID=1324956 RepID=A0A4R3MW98_9BACI|nr:sulfurtransferase TusA family protein [Melghiribacillus thermohalophilus]TCT20017.1 rhodanese-related sulfurtransferase [Melghiribacillus thermohalophilus]
MKADFTVDASGLTCPMPIVKTKKAMNNLEGGQVLEVLATDKGSIADIQAWAESTGHQYLGTKEDGEVLKHYIRKASEGEEKEEKKYDKTIDNNGLKSKLNEDITIIDVREPAEYAFGHIPGALSIPMGELEERLNEIEKDKDVYVVCRTGNRSDMAAQKLSEKGYHVINVVPGMSEWDGPIEKSDS